MNEKTRPTRLKDAEFDDLFALLQNWDGDPSCHQMLNLRRFLKSASNFCTPSMVVLDISAGECRYRAFFKHAQYVAIDSLVGDENWNYDNLDIVGDALNLPILPESVDVCLNTVSLEHYSDPFQAFKEFARVLKPGGTLFLYSPFADYEHQIPNDYFRVTRYGLAHLCESNSLAVKSLRPSNSIFETALDLIDMTVQMLPDPEAREKLLKILRGTFKPVFVEADKVGETCVDFPRVSRTFQFPALYLLRAVKLGHSEPTPIHDKHSKLLRRIIACPECKKPLEWCELQQRCSDCKRVFSMTDKRLQLSAKNAGAEPPSAPKFFQMPDSESLSADELLELKKHASKLARESKSEDEALATFAQVLSEDAEDAEIWNDLGVLHYGWDKPHLALECLEWASQLESAGSHVHVNLGDVCQERGLPWDALRAYRRAFVCDPSDLELLWRLGAILIKLNMHGEAEEIYKKILEFDPDDTQAQRTLNELEEILAHRCVG